MNNENREKKLNHCNEPFFFKKKNFKSSNCVTFLSLKSVNELKRLTLASCVKRFYAFT